MPDGRRDVPAGERGLALVTVLWVLVLLAALAAGFSGTTRSGALTARNVVDAVRAEALADAGIYRAILELLAADADGRALPEGVHTWAMADGEVRLVIADEAGKIDLNAAPLDLLARLFVAAGVDGRAAERLAAAVVDYRDPDGDREPGGAEDPDYRAAGLSHGAKDDAFVLVDELAQVLGFDEAIFATVAPALTVYTNRPQPAVTAAPELVRTALAMGNGGRAAAARQPLAAGLAAGETADGGSGRFTVHAEARVTAGGIFVREAVVALAPAAVPPYRILAWRQGRRVLFGDAEAGRPARGQ